MKRNNKFWRAFLFAVLALLIAILLLLAAALISGKIFFEKDDSGHIWLVVDNTNGEKSEYEQTAEAMKKDYPTDIFVYGEDCNFMSFVPYTDIQEISRESVKSDKTYKVIIVNDMYGNTPLTDADYQLLYQLVIDGEYSFAYVGKSKLRSFVEKGFIEDYFMEEDAGFQIRNRNEGGTTSVGFWTDTTQAYYDEGATDILGETLIAVFVKRIIQGR